MKNVIITGATSFLGIAILENLLKSNIENIFAVVRPSSFNRDRLPNDSRIHILSLDLSDITQLKEKNLPPIDVFYHLAWNGTRAVDRDDEQLQSQNYIYSIEAIKTAVDIGCKAFIGAGSQAEYGIISGRIDEVESEEKPLTAYGKAKLKVCCEGKSLTQETDMRFIWTRIFSLYGSNDYENTLIISCLKKMRNNSPVELTECSQMWDFLHVSDAAEAFVRLGTSTCAKGVYNIASGKALPLKEFVKEMAQIAGSVSLLNFGVISYPPQGAVGFEPDISRLVNETGWLPEIQFKDGIIDILMHMERQERHENY